MAWALSNLKMVSMCRSKLSSGISRMESPNPYLFTDHKPGRMEDYARSIRRLERPRLTDAEMNRKKGKAVRRNPQKQPVLYFFYSPMGICPDTKNFWR
jgi:hypothetical protein